MGSRWNVDGVLSMSEIPAEFADFVKAKQLQLLTNVLSSAAAGVVLANVAALFAGDASLAVLGETVQAAVPLIAIAAIASVGAGSIGAVRQ